MLPWAALHAILFLLAFGLLVPFLDLAVEARTSRARLAWIAATPLGALAELTGRPKDVPGRVPGTIEVGSPEAPVRIEAMVHPMCSGCAPVVRQLLELQRVHEEAICLSFHMPPRDLTSRADRELCAALAALGVHSDGMTAMGKFLELETDPWAALEVAGRGGGIELLAEWTGLPAGDLRLAERMDRGRQAVRVADDLAVRLQRGTPTVLIGGRPWEAPVADLAALLARQPGLLAAAIGVRFPTGRNEGVHGAPPRPGHGGPVRGAPSPD